MAHLHLRTILNPPHVTLEDHAPYRRSLWSIIEYITTGELESRLKSKSHYDNRDYSEHILYPNFTVRETNVAYYLEGEFLGVHNADDIIIEYLGPRQVSIRGNSSDIDLSQEWGYEFEDANLHQARGQIAESSLAPQQISAKVDPNPGDHSQQPGEMPNYTQGATATVLLSERHNGPLKRSFTFPESIDYDKLRARLKDGVLRVRIQKARTESTYPRYRVEYSS
ncbi:uncharacterized protein A1O9_09434 [Exophiala aquamarina CBS 119918]|uniref:SHSP domain-containing protein n=1 Tax=Exophiala aquamarina CBS 119918 TaxID=1182545 RepID=A0A072P4V3_9EURO|nr:uncharacterized protein A1O9_09434 [Exophiala aquamarina CBS 119918]KEF54268.1 hypothetical protein A1O9_09434 [Exophiala aquamarina CBS 119918]